MSTPAIASQVQAVADDLDYSFDYGKAPWMRPGDAIASSSWAVSPAGPSLHDPAFTSLTTTTWVTSGPAGTYVVTNSIVTSTTPPRKFSRAFTLVIE